jgi:hypothetical protein
MRQPQVSREARLTGFSNLAGSKDSEGKDLTKGSSVQKCAGAASESLIILGRCSNPRPLRERGRGGRQTRVQRVLSKRRVRSP